MYWTRRIFVGVDGHSDETVSSWKTVPQWIKFVALFMLTFAVFDVCTPERCDAQILTATQSQTQFQTQHNESGPATCQFEEDCFSCAHYAPGTSLAFDPVTVVPLKDSHPAVLSLDGMPLLPYHPPRT